MESQKSECALDLLIAPRHNHSDVRICVKRGTNDVHVINWTLLPQPSGMLLAGRAGSGAPPAFHSTALLFGHLQVIARLVGSVPFP